MSGDYSNETPGKTRIRRLVAGGVISGFDCASASILLVFLLVATRNVETSGETRIRRLVAGGVIPGFDFASASFLFVFLLVALEAVETTRRGARTESARSRLAEREIAFRRRLLCLFQLLQSLRLIQSLQF